MKWLGIEGVLESIDLPLRVLRIVVRRFLSDDRWFGMGEFEKCR